MNLKVLPLKIAAVIVASSTLLVACDDTRVRVSADSGPRHSGHGHGHGRYHTHTPHNHRVTYNSGLGLYVVHGLANTYWNGSNYYRFHNHGWQLSSDYRRWNGVGLTYIPRSLHKRHRHTRRHRNNNRVRIIRPY